MKLILTSMRDRGEILNPYRTKLGELVVATVVRPETGNIVVDLEGAEAVLPMREQVPGELYRAGDRIMAYLVESDDGAHGSQIIISRAHKGLLEKLFEMEVPEIYDRIVRIEASAREPGAHSKIAVSSLHHQVNPLAPAATQEARGRRMRAVRSPGTRSVRGVQGDRERMLANRSSVTAPATCMDLAARA